MAATAKSERAAHFKFDKGIGKAGGTITVAVPKGVTDKEFVAVLGKIRGLTACKACANSGGHRVIFEEIFDDILRF